MSDLVWPEIKLGKYKHSKKGMIVEVVGVGKHSETLEDFVIYIHDGNYWIRPIAMFFEEVEVDGKKVKRFEKVES